MSSCFTSFYDATLAYRAGALVRQFNLNIADPAATQAMVLRGLVRSASSTKFGRAHGFSQISTVRAFQDQVPLRHYEDFHREFWHPDFPTLVDCTWPGTIPYFALSSGTTTGRSKYIPCSRETLMANWRGLNDIFAHHVLNRPFSAVLGGKSLVLGGSTALRQEAPGVYSGDLSGIEACEVAWWVQPWIIPSREIALISDWEEKVERLAQASINEDIRSISGTPNWLLAFFEKLFALSPRRPTLAACFPNLELIIHGGIGFAPYRERFRKLLVGTHAETREVYFASEGFLAVADAGDGEGLRLELDGGVFFEFVPVSELGRPKPRRCWIGNVEMGVEYAVVVSTCSGLWAYSLGDTVNFVSLSPPRVLITGRTSYVLSAVGEHLIGEEIDEAIRFASEQAGVSVTDYAVGCLALEETVPQHVYIIECAAALKNGNDQAEQRFACSIDAKLKELNDDYAVHRTKDFGLKAPRVIAVRAGTFARWMKQRGRLGGQNKVPRIVNDPALFASLRELALEASCA